MSRYVIRRAGKALLFRIRDSDYLSLVETSGPRR